MLATSYTAATSGKARSHPEFWHHRDRNARAGCRHRRRDPRVINLRARLYVPGYGLAVAAIPATHQR